MEHPPRRDTSRNVFHKRRVKELKAKLHVGDESRRLYEALMKAKFVIPTLRNQSAQGGNTGLMDQDARRVRLKLLPLKGGNAVVL
jgi:hypothetical protein